MSRLEEALNKAAMSKDAEPLVEPALDVLEPSDRAEAPAAAPSADWQFEESRSEGVTEQPVETEAARRPASTWDLPAAMESYQFGEVASGKTIVGPGAESCLVEQYRRLAASLHHAQLQRGVRTVMVTSAVASEGKTLTATNLALTMSQSYKRRVLLIDADLRRPTVHEVFRTENTVGLGDVLRRPEIRRLPLLRLSPTLWILPAGRPDSDPMSGLVSEEMKLLLAEASEHFDWVIVDTPPVALLSDANLLAAMIDVSILVVSANSTPFPLVRRAVDSVGPERILGIVLNRIDRAQMVGGYGYYDYYGYGKSDAAQAPAPPLPLSEERAS